MTGCMVLGPNAFPTLLSHRQWLQGVCVKMPAYLGGHSEEFSIEAAVNVKRCVVDMPEMQQNFDSSALPPLNPESSTFNPSTHLVTPLVDYWHGDVVNEHTHGLAAWGTVGAALALLNSTLNAQLKDHGRGQGRERDGL